MKRIFALFFFVVLVQSLSSQEFDVRSFEADASDMAARRYLQTTSALTPCNQLDFYSDKDYFRATAAAKDQNLQTAERIASLDARAQLTSMISVRVESVTRSYFLEQKIGDHTKHTAIFESINRLTSSLHLKNIRVVCTETDYENGQFIASIAVEIATEDVLTSLLETFSNEPETKESYDKSRLEKIFIKEIETLKDE